MNGGTQLCQLHWRIQYFQSPAETLHYLLQSKMRGQVSSTAYLFQWRNYVKKGSDIFRFIVSVNVNFLVTLDSLCSRRLTNLPHSVLSLYP